MASTLDVINKACQPKEYISLDKISPNDYEVKGFKLIKTKYGDRIRAELDSKFVFLPTREQEISEEMVDELNQKKIIMSYQGKNSNGGYIVHLMDMADILS